MADHEGIKQRRRQGLVPDILVRMQGGSADETVCLGGMPTLFELKVQGYIAAASTAGLGPRVGVVLRARQQY